MVKKLLCIFALIIILSLFIYIFPKILEIPDIIDDIYSYMQQKEGASEDIALMFSEWIDDLNNTIFIYIVFFALLVSCAALIIAYPLRFSFQGYREKYDAWVQLRKEAAFQRKYRKAKKNMEQEKKKLEKMEKEKAGK